jgi:predicted transcriptional regulator
MVRGGVEMKGQLTVRLTDELKEGVATLASKLRRKRSDKQSIMNSEG